MGDGGGDLTLECWRGAFCGGRSWLLSGGMAASGGGGAAGTAGGAGDERTRWAALAGSANGGVWKASWRGLMTAGDDGCWRGRTGAEGWVRVLDSRRRDAAGGGGRTQGARSDVRPRRAGWGGGPRLGRPLVSGDGSQWEDPKAAADDDGPSRERVSLPLPLLLPLLPPLERRCIRNRRGMCRGRGTSGGGRAMTVSIMKVPSKRGCTQGWRGATVASAGRQRNCAAGAQGWG